MAMAPRLRWSRSMSSSADSRTWIPWVGLASAMTLASVAGCSSTLPDAAKRTEPSVTPVAGASASTTLDGIFENAWRKAHLAPSAPIDDATYLRRVSLDLVGRIPTSTEVRAFTSDTSPDKRSKKVDALLASPEHASNMARIFDAVLMGRETKAAVVDRGAFDRWLELAFAEKTPWNRIVTEIVTATGKNSLGGAKGLESFEGGIDKAREEEKEGIRPATNFVLRHVKAPQDLAGDVSRIFLGVQIQCAQCHDHKTEKWKQTDFQSFAAVFTNLRPEPIDREKGTIRVLDLEDINRTPPRLLKKGGDEMALIAASTPRALDGTDLSTGETRRKELAEWMTSPKNPWFAKAFVNRTWGSLFGEGFVDPVDDFRDSSPPVLPEALDLLAEHFVASGYDIDALYREILASEPYRCSVDGTGSGSARDAAFSRGELQAMSGDQLLDSIFTATEIDRSLDKARSEVAEKVKVALRKRMAFVFDDDVESNADGYDGTVQQALMLMNGTLAGASTGVVPGNALESLVRGDGTDASRIEELYLRTMSREPEAAEVARWQAFLAAPRDFDVRDPPSAIDAGKIKKLGKDPLQGKRIGSRAHTTQEQAYEDMFWTLLNSSEFFFRR